MPDLIFKTVDGRRQVVAAPSGISVMRAATGAGVDGIIGECGGCMTCMTCHCYVDPARLADLPAPSGLEADMVESLLDGRPNSRLTCQIVVTAQLDGLELDVPARQG